ncbi:serine carboxypeptidase S28-domain-containing protein [Xylariomycetidae sp. FL0641]|nr:serine carboxypeptidase S28-domain-containing protein [Xylariomycetidae sp. FL0641]
MKLKHLILLALSTSVSSQQSNPPGNGTFEGMQDAIHVFNTPGNGSFSQRYQIDIQHFKPGGPILLVQAAESGMPLLSTVDFIDYASELHAAVAVLEHPFFGGRSGGSYPVAFNAKDIATVPKTTFASLTLEKVLEDGANFARWLKSSIPGANESQVIYGGSSYGGFLAVSARLQYPDVFSGAIASSPALTSFGPLPVNGERFDAAAWVSNVYSNMSLTATTQITQAMATFEQCVAADSCSDVLPDLNICSHPSNDTYGMVYNATVQLYSMIPQFNYPWQYVFPSPNPLQDLVGKTLSADTDDQVLRIPLLAATWTDDESECIDPSNPNITNPDMMGIQPAFQYIKCAYYAVNDLSIPDMNILPSRYGRGNVPICTNPNWTTVDYYSPNEYFTQKYALTEQDLNNVERLLIVQNSYDRNAAIGSPALEVTELFNHSRVIFVDGLARAEDAVSEAVEPRGLKPGLDQIRDAKMAHLKEWLGRGNQTAPNSARTRNEGTRWPMWAICCLPMLISVL